MTRKARTTALTRAGMLTETETPNNPPRQGGNDLDDEDSV
jgi:hypothetical protein